jgi:hypothetical protein
MIRTDNAKTESMSIEEYLEQFENELTHEEYLRYEVERVSKLNWSISGRTWKGLLNQQNFKCFYCETSLNLIQQLVLIRVIDPRRRGKDGFSGLHFELDHKNANKSDNSSENLVASCYYCNNDKSNTIKSQVFKDYFGKQKGVAFQVLIEANKIDKSISLSHHYYTVES